MTKHHHIESYASKFREKLRLAKDADKLEDLDGLATARVADAKPRKKSDNGRKTRWQKHK